MNRYTRAEIAAIEADGAYWKEFGDAIGWRLIGFDYRDRASFYTKSNCPYRAGFVITGPERDAIMAAIQRGGK